MTEEIKLKIKKLEEHRKILCQECNELEQELRMLEDEIEDIDKEIFRLELPPEERGE